MVTRNIAKNNGTQVNAVRIGVQVLHPISGIVADYSTYTATLALGYVEGETQYGWMFADTDGNVYYNTLVTETISESTYYIHKRFGSDTNYYCTKTTADLVPGDLVYVKQDDALVQDGEVANLLSVSGQADQIGSVSFKISDTVYTSFVYGGETFIKNDQDVILGWISAITETVAEGVQFTPQATSTVEGKTEWSGDSKTIWTDSAEPSVGDVVYTCADELTWNQSEISEVINEGEINCVVSYSIDGYTWTEHPTVLTDENNVICNIPRYVYLKFSQDTVITEE